MDSGVCRVGKSDENGLYGYGSIVFFGQFEQEHTDSAIYY